MRSLGLRSTTIRTIRNSSRWWLPRTSRVAGTSARCERMKRQNVSVLDAIKEMLDRGRNSGIFRSGFDAITFT